MMALAPKDEIVGWGFAGLAVLALGGTAAQAFGLYVGGLLIPGFFFARRGDQKGFWGKVTAYCLGWAALYLLYPLVNVLRWAEGARGLPWGELSRSHLSSAVMGVAVVLGAIALWRRFDRRRVDEKAPALQPFALFTQALAIASAVLLLWALVQRYTGWAVQGDLGPAKLMAAGGFRVLGFYSHPLSLASVSLALATFYACWLGLARDRAGDQTRRAWAIVGCHSVLVLMSGSRFAALLLPAILGAVAMATLGRTGRWRRGILAAGLLAAVSGAGLWGFGVGERIAEIRWHQVDRLTFWNVYRHLIADRPRWGYGHSWLKHQDRPARYEELGLGAFSRQYNAHNIYLEVLADVGALGFLAILGILAWMAWRFRRQLWPRQSAALVALAVSLGANALHGLTQNTFYDANVTYVYLSLWLVLLWQHLAEEPGASARVPQRSRDQAERFPAPG